MEGVSVGLKIGMIMSNIQNTIIVLLAVIFGLISFAFSYSHEHAKLGQIPIGFSEIGQTRKCIYQLSDFLNTDKCGNIGPLKEVPALTEYYSDLNDIFMMIAEANNIARTQWFGAGDKFAYELEKKMDSSFRIHTQIPEYINRLKDIVEKAKTSILPLTKVRHDLAPVIQDLEYSWNESHVDNYHTEYYTTESCDSKGSCTTQTNSRQVYDNTTHYYTYNKNYGFASARDLKIFFKENPDISINENLIHTWQTNAENEMAIRDSRKYTAGYKVPNQDDYLKFANTWATGSNYEVLKPEIYKEYKNLYQYPNPVVNTLMTAHSETYTTYSHYDSGPKEYQITQAALSISRNLEQNIGIIENGIDDTDKMAPILCTKIQDYVNAKLHGIGKEGSLESEIIDDSTFLYKNNFINGFDVSPAKWWHTVLWTLFGLLLGGGLPLGFFMTKENLRYRS